MDKVIFKCTVIFYIVLVVKSFPLNECDTLYGVPVSDKMDHDPHYEEPKYLLPLIFEDDEEPTDEHPPFFPAPHEGECNLIKHVGYAHVNAIQHKLMPLDEFMERKCLPENVHFKIMENAHPVFQPQHLCNDIDAALVPGP